jgi:hypothetical protein
MLVIEDSARNRNESACKLMKFQFEQWDKNFKYLDPKKKHILVSHESWKTITIATSLTKRKEKTCPFDDKCICWIIMPNFIMLKHILQWILWNIYLKHIFVEMKTTMNKQWLSFTLTLLYSFPYLSVPVEPPVTQQLYKFRYLKSQGQETKNCKVWILNLKKS